MIMKNYSNSNHKANTDGLLSKMMALGFPVAIQSALVAILSLADVLMVSDFGQVATASVGIASKWHFIATMIIGGMASANGILIAQYWGKNDQRSAKTISLLALKNGIKILLPVTILITVFSGTLMQLQTSDIQVIELGSTYLIYSFPVLLLTHFVMVYESVLRSSGDTFTPLIFGTVTIFINIGLNYLLIKGGLGIPAMGVAGAALATTLSRLLQVIAMSLYLYSRKHWLFFAETLAQSDKLWQSYKKIAIPSTLSALTWAAGVLAYQMIFGHLGTTELAVYSMIGPFESLCYSIFFGISVSCSVLLGQSLGRDQFSYAQIISKFFIKIVLILGIVTGIILILTKPIVLSWLNLDSPILSHLASPALTILSASIWLRMLNTVIINGILRAGGDNHFCLRMDFISSWLVGVPLTAYAAFVLHWEFHYVYMMMLTESLIKLLLCSHRYLKQHWIKNLTLSTI